jgi:hypothetical protein
MAHLPHARLEKAGEGLILFRLELCPIVPVMENTIREQGAPNMPVLSAESISFWSPRGLGSQSANKLLHGYQGDSWDDVRKDT